MSMEARMEKRLASLMEGKVEEDIPKLTDIPGHYPAFLPKTKQSVGYIVSAVIASPTGTGEVLMIQEARPKAAKGKWYLPAGKVEPNEKLEAAVIRIVKAKSGYEFKPKSMVTVEVCTGHWYRFTFTGRICGGHVKTKDTRDDNSIQARWFPISVIRDQRLITLRSEDILPVITEGLRFSMPRPRHPSTLPLEKSYPTLVYRLLLVHPIEAGRISVLVNKKCDGTFPVGAINPKDNWIHETKYRIVEEIFGREDVRTKTHGVLSVEYLPTADHQTDGVCITCLVSTDEQKAQHKEKYDWVPLMDAQLTKRIEERMIDGMCIPLMDIH